MEQKHTREEKMAAFGRMLDILDELRVKCPWDRKQTNESLRPNTIEETYELCDALIKGDDHEVMKELGDVLLHVAFYARIGEEKGQFDIADVCNFLCDKLIFRHPHVYGEQKAESVEQVLDNWEQIKQREKDGNKTVLSGVPAALPSLIKAYRIQDKARHVGFDWEQRDDVWNKVREELGELEAELKKEDRQASEQELGDFLFSVINAARLYKLNPDNALEMTNQKFIRRFNYIEQRSREMGKPMTDMKKLSVLMTVAVAVWMMASCGGKTQQVPFDDGDSADIANADPTIYGVCGEGTAMNTLQLLTDTGDTLSIDISDAQDNGKVFGGLLVGDRMAVLPTKDKTQAVMVINQATLLGNWVMPNPIDGSDEVGVRIKEGGVAESIAQSDIVYKTWRLIRGQMEFVLMRESGSGEDETYVYDIAKLGPDSLTGKDVKLEDASLEEFKM